MEMLTKFDALMLITPDWMIDMDHSIVKQQVTSDTTDRENCNYQVRIISLSLFVLVYSSNLTFRFTLYCSLH